MREAPCKVLWYEPFRPNQIWGEDWTILSMEYTWHYLLTITDCFSLYLIAWGLVKTITRLEVQNLLTLAHLSEGIRPASPKPLLGIDQGSPNMVHSTQRMIRNLERILSPSRANRPTDNGRQERWYRTVKQEEIHCYPAYSSVEVASLLSPLYRFLSRRAAPSALWN